MIAENGGGLKEGWEGEKEYVIVYGISGYDVCPEERVDYQEKDIRKIAQSAGVRISNVYMRTRARKFVKRIECASTEPYYKERQKGDFQDIMFLSTMDKVEHFVKVVSDVARELAYPISEMGVYMQPILFGRACHIEFSFAFNGDDPTEVESMRSLYRKGSEALSKAGAFFSRPYGDWSELAYARCPDTVTALRKVKDIFDPEHILNRGKLVFDRAEVG
jgi:FAD/FMN-containing dehydrogenase